MQERIITKTELRTVVPYSETHLKRLEDAGKFPRRIKLGPGRVGYVWSEILKWIDDRKAERDGCA